MIAEDGLPVGTTGDDHRCSVDGPFSLHHPVTKGAARLTVRTAAIELPSTLVSQGHDHRDGKNERHGDPPRHRATAIVRGHGGSTATNQGGVDDQQVEDQVDDDQREHDPRPQHSPTLQSPSPTRQQLPAGLTRPSS